MRTTMRTILTFVTVAFIWSCSASKMNLTEMSTKGFQIVYKPKIGSVAKYMITSNSDITQNMMGQEQNFGTKSDMSMILKVSGVTENEINYDVTFESATIESNAPGLTGIGDYKEKLLSSNVKITSDPFGKVTKITGTEAIKKLALGSNIDILLKNLFIIFPEKVLKIGDSWPHKETNTVKSGPLNLDINSNTTYKFVGVETKQNTECLRFDVEVSMKLSGKGQQNGMDLEFDGSGTGTGTIYFDYANGVFVNITSNSQTDGVVAIPSQGMDIPMTVVQTAEINLVK